MWTDIVEGEAYADFLWLEAGRYGQAARSVGATTRSAIEDQLKEKAELFTKANAAELRPSLRADGDGGGPGLASGGEGGGGVSRRRLWLPAREG